MAIVDIIVLGIIIISLLIGAFRGLVKEALSLVFWALAVIASMWFSDDLAARLGGFVSNPAFRKMVAFGIIFIITVFAGGIISNFISKLTSAAGLKATDRALGALFGILRGVVIVTLIVTLTMSFEAVRSYYNESITVPYLLVLAEYFQHLLGMSSEPAVAGLALHVGQHG